MNHDGSVSFEELLAYANMNREHFQLLIGAGNRHTKGMIAYDAAVRPKKRMQEARAS